MTERSNSWQSYLLGIGAVLIGAGIIGLTSALTGLQSDIEVMKTDLTYMKQRAETAETFRTIIADRVSDHEARLKVIESDKTRTQR